MFVDRVKIFVKGGDGGRGCSSFRREAYVPMGGPDGGNGGAGGDVILVGRVNQNTLLPLRFHTEFRAKRGGHGGPSNRTGRDAHDTRIDVPGIIEGASTGAGLGLDFLRHIERTRVLAHVIDASGLSGQDAVSDYETICRELKAFSETLATRPRILVASKRDIVGEEDPLPSIRQIAEREGLELFEVSAATGKGLKELRQRLATLLQPARDPVEA